MTNGGSVVWAPTAEILRREFRHLPEVVECALVDSSTFREGRRRPAMIVDLDSVQQVAAALADVAELYRQSVCPAELIEEARTLHRLVVVTKARMAFFDGVKLDVDSVRMIGQLIRPSSKWLNDRFPGGHLTNWTTKPPPM